MWLARPGFWFAAGLLLAGPGCVPKSTPPSTAAVDKPSLKSDDEAQVEAFCSKCHRPPLAESFPRDRWVHEVYRGYRFFHASPLKEQATPPVEQAIQYYTKRAPEHLPPPAAIPFVIDELPRFQRSLKWEVKPVVAPSVSYLSWKQWAPDGAARLALADMGAGAVLTWDPNALDYQPLAFIPHPASLEWCDLNRDGLLDLLVGNLGSFEPRDHDRGSVVWLRQQSDGRFKPKSLAEGLGRVSEVRVGDFLGRGELELVVAEFGWQQTGSLLLLEPRFDETGQVQVSRRRLDQRHGAIRVPPLDLDGDGKLDFVTLFGQEHESVEVFLNRGSGRFEPRPLCPPREPAFGSSGLEPADLDGDGDIDFVVSNGDMFDSFFIKPYHGLRWLENRGGLDFAEHPLLTMAGVQGAAIGDLDLDGDLDIVTSACFPGRVFEEVPETDRAHWPSAVWLEQTSPGAFAVHPLEFGNPFHACLTLADTDDDGDLDVVLGIFAGDRKTPQAPFVVFENLTRSNMPKPE